MKESEVRKLLEQKGLPWDAFMEWMIGQTVSQDENEGTIYWASDVEAFIRFKKHGVRLKDFD